MKEFICRFCGRKFSNGKQYSGHMGKHVSYTMSWRCIPCGTVTKTKIEMISHFISVHVGFGKNSFRVIPSVKKGILR